MSKRPAFNDFNNGKWEGLWSELEARCLRSEAERDKARSALDQIRQCIEELLGKPIRCNSLEAAAELRAAHSLCSFDCEPNVCCTFPPGDTASDTNGP